MGLIFYVYRHYIGDNTFYVGSNYVAGNENRAYSKKGRNKIWREIVKQNEGKYQIEIVKRFDTSKEALEYETSLQKHYWSIGQCEASLQHSPSATKKISEKAKTRSRKQTEATKKKIGAKQVGRVKSPEEIAKIRAANLGRALPPEALKRRGASISKAKLQKRILINTTTNETIVFGSVTETRQWLKENLNAGSTIARDILYNQKEYKNYKLLEEK